ncbi:hypothetical protein ACFC0N_34620 [Streptomyces zaomyceticus]|uniref:hypothetical protein n=1 Tax=Streptomyces zaomyceticus TaxID=68286 RepID=UPI0035D6C564
MSLLPILWALKSAPVSDTTEKLLLVTMAEHAFVDGCDAFPSKNTLADIAMTDPKTVQRKLRALEARKLIALGDQSAARYIDARYRPKVYDLLIPYSWFPDVQQVNAERQQRGRPPLTAENRPSIAAAPARKRRSDLGKSRKAQDAGDGEDREDSQSPLREDAGDSPGGTDNPTRGDYESHEGGLTDPQSSPDNPPLLNRPEDTRGDGRRPSTSSNGRGGRGVAASSKTAARRKVPAAGLRTVVASVPSVLAAQLENEFPRGLPASVNEAIGLALEDRTVDQVVARVERRWLQWSYENDAVAESGSGLGRPLGVLLTLLGPSACWGNNARCEDGTDIDTGVVCPRCEEAREDRAAAGRSQDGPPAAGYSVPFERPTDVEPSPYVQCRGAGCGLKMMPTEDGLCRECRTEGAFT